MREKLGEDRHQQLVDMARESKQKLIDDELKDGLLLLQDMRKMLGKRG